VLGLNRPGSLAPTGGAGRVPWTDGRQPGLPHGRRHNADTESENRIHDDSVARRHGFGGGLVPGVTLYAYMAHVPAALWGREWIERGTMAARFLKPVYDGERVEAVGEPVGGAGEGAPAAVTLRLVGPDGETRATGRASLPEAPRGLPAPGTADPPGGATGADLIDDPTERPLPRASRRPPPGRRAIAAPGTGARHRRRPLPRPGGPRLPGGDPRGPGPLLRRSGSRTRDGSSASPTPRWPRTSRSGRGYTSRARPPTWARSPTAPSSGSARGFSEEYERHGHRYALLDGLLVTTTGAGAPEPVACPVMHVHHRVIYRLRG